MTKEKLLVVENNSKYLATAEKYFAKLKNVKADFIIDYENARAALPNYKAGKALIDIFIPESETVRLGKVGNDLTKEIGPRLKEREIQILREWMNGAEKLMKEKFPEAHKYHQALMDAAKNYSSIEDPVFLSLPSTKKLLGNLLNAVRIDCEFPSKIEKDINEELQAIEQEKRKGHSPLGIRIAEQCYASGIPFCFVTDNDPKYGHPGGTCQAVVDFFINKHGYRPKLINSVYGKKDVQRFWEVAYESLQTK